MTLAQEQAKTAATRTWAGTLTKRHLDEFEQALADPRLVSLRQELALVDLRIADVKRRAETTGETPASWAALDIHVADLRSLAREIAIPDPVHQQKFTAKIEALAALAGAGLSELSLWDELKDLIERRRRLADTERKYEELKEVSIPKAQLAALFGELQLAIEAALPSRALQLAMLHELHVRLNGERRDVRKTVPVELPPSYALAAAADDGTRERSDLDSTPVEPESSG